MQTPDKPAEPWYSFFRDIDQSLEQETHLHCCGGFVVAQRYGVSRTTSDVDVLSVNPSNNQAKLLALAGEGSELRQRHKVYLDVAAVSTPPENYGDRLDEIYPGLWTNLKLFALEPHDLALTKLERNMDKDREDVQLMARAGYLDPDTLRRRYYQEQRTYLTREAWHDATLRLWLESNWPDYDFPPE